MVALAAAEDESAAAQALGTPAQKSETTDQQECGEALGTQVHGVSAQTVPQLDLANLDFSAFAFAGCEVAETTPPIAPASKKRKAPRRSDGKGTAHPADAADLAAGAGAPVGAAAGAAAGAASCADAAGDDAVSDRATPAKSSKRPKYRKAEERKVDDGRVMVEVICKDCRRSRDASRQGSLAGFLGRAAPASFSHGEAKAGEGSADVLCCSRCLRPMQMDRFQSMDTEKRPAAAKGGCPLAAQLKRYKQAAVQTGAAWELTDSQALAMMREPCVLCGKAPDLVRGIVSGITRLRQNGGVRSMGPFSIANTASCCAACNVMKGIHTLDAIREICKHIASHQGCGSFGSFPERFVDNTSRRSKSCYLADNKTIALTDAEFKAIVEQPCHYCGKAPEKGKHYNGLDRVENSVRVYTINTVVSCCGTCNMAKGKHTTELFLEKCKEIAERAGSESV